MTDWDAVERLRSKGWDWDRIAGDPKVDFHAEESAGEPGRALRALYYQRRSRQQRRPSKGSKAERDADAKDPSRPKWSLARVGYLLTPLFAVWLLLAYLYPSPVGVYVTAFPTLLFLFIVALGVLCFGLLRSVDKWTTVYRNAVIMGAVAGLALAAIFGLASVAAGCPSLTPNVSAEPSNWEKANNPAWTSGGSPVFFFYGSIACPYCSASSWSMYLALQKFGSLSGYSFGYSSPTDQAGPNTPEIILAGTSYQSQYIAMDVAEATDPTTITYPTISNCVEQAYVSTYSAGIPFNVVNGIYIHTGTMVQPSALHGMTTSQVLGQISNQSGPAWDAVSGPSYVLEAFMVKACGCSPPSGVATDPNVTTILTQIH
ncbi:MAG: DUF929 domain-containing protein [Thermoplasmata archaeon]|nr:DUF929 domain-containing protein [Thermoplasmata archaeon]